jgi:imidazolonepropionase-like amidohydrolase
MQLQPDEIQAAVLEAREAGRRVAAHAHPARAIRVAAEAGVVSIEHGALLDDEAIEALVRCGTYLVPTQAVYQRIADNVDGWPAGKAEVAQGIMAEKVPTLRRAIQAGVKIGVGTDSGRHFPAGAIADEVLALAGAGLSPEQALLAATRGNAELLGLQDEVGTVEVGKRADLVLLGGDPLADLGHLKDVRLVVLNGRPLDPRALTAHQSANR